MHPLTPILSLIFAIAAFAYLFYLRPKLDDKRSKEDFDNRVLGVIDGLTLADVPVGLCSADLRSYIRRNLAGARNLPDGEYLLNYTAANGFRYESYTGRGDHILFAVLCLVRYAHDTGRPELLAWCEDHLEIAQKGGFNWR